MSTTQVGPQDVISHLAAVYGRQIAENYHNRINVALTGNPAKDEMVKAMMNWLSESLREVTPGSMVIQVTVNAPAPVSNTNNMGGAPFNPNNGFPAGGGFPAGQMQMQMAQAPAHNHQASNVGNCPKDGARELQGLGVSARVPVGAQKPAGAKCGIKFGKKDFGSEKFYCTKDATEVNPHLNVWTCTSHKKNKTTGDAATKSGSRVSPVVAASAIKGVNNGLFAPSGVTPTPQQVGQIGGMMTQNPGFIQPVQGNFQAPGQFQQPQASQQFTIPQGATNNPMANQVFSAVSQDLQRMQPQQSIQEGSNQVSFGQHTPNTFQVQQQPPPQQNGGQAPGGLQFNASHFTQAAPIPQGQVQSFQHNNDDDEDNEDDDGEGTSDGEDIGSFQAPQMVQQQPQPVQQQGQAPVDNAISQAQPVQQPPQAQAPGQFDFAKLMTQQQQAK